MRPLKPVLVVAAMLAAALASCKKDDAIVPSPATYISLNFDSQNYRTSNLQVTDSVGFMTVLGIFNSDTMIQLTVHKPKKGAFKIHGGEAGASFSADYSCQYVSDEGTLNITSVSGDTLRGNFRLHCVDLASGHTCELINGGFEIVHPEH